MKIRNTEIFVEKGDITKQDTQALVNEACNLLYMDERASGSIKKKGGSKIQDEAVKSGSLQAGQSVITTAGNLKAKYAIHACVAVKDKKTDDLTIRKATGSVLNMAQQKKITSISFCALGCGIGCFPAKDSAKIMAQEVFKYVRETKKPSLRKIVFILHSDGELKIFKKNVLGYIEHLIEKTNQGPYLTVDGIVEYKKGIVLIERLNPPFGWALPGGFVDYGESVEESVKREVKEETNLDFLNFKQFQVYSNPGRDPRFHTASVVFIGKGKGNLDASSDAKEAYVFSLDALPERIAFDHRQIIEDYIKSMRLGILK